MEFDATVANFGIYNKKVINAVCNMKESIRVFPIMVKWIGFKTAKIDVNHSERLEGASSYNLKQLMNLALNIILAYSDKPIRIIIKMGMIISLTSFFYAFYTLWKLFSGSIKVSGYASLIISIWFLSGVIIVTLGMIGLYVGKIFEGVKNRPIYIIGNKINLK
jgi:dolichol-phosphate mannosyltransferase